MNQFFLKYKGDIKLSFYASFTWSNFHSVPPVSMLFFFDLEYLSSST